MASHRFLPLTLFAVGGLLLGQVPDTNPGTGPPTSGTPGPRKTQAPPAPGGIPRPPLGKSKRRSQAAHPNLTAAITTSKGMLVSLGAERMIVLADDKRVLRNQVSPAATYYYMEGKERKTLAPADLKPGDHLIIDSAQDEDGEWWVVQVTRERPGTDEDQKRVAGLDEGIKQARVEPIPGGEPDPGDRPKIRRKDSKEPKESKEPEPALEPERPARPTTIQTTKDEGDDEYGRRPLQRRGKPVMTASTSTPPASEPPVKAGEWKEDPPMIGAAPDQEHPILVKAREQVSQLQETMPNYFCQQITTRYLATKRAKQMDFTAQDVISAEVVVEDGRERYRNLQLNFRPTKKTLDELGGSRSTGEFQSMILDLFDRGTQADFRSSHPETIANRAAYVFRFSVDQPHSHWTIHHPSQSYRPAYKGSVWIDRETGNVLRLEMQATKIPRDFPYDIIEQTSDYDYVRIGARSYLVPVKAENLACEMGTGYCAKNSIEFRNYRKFAAESEILPSDSK